MLNSKNITDMHLPRKRSRVSYNSLLEKAFILLVIIVQGLLLYIFNEITSQTQQHDDDIEELKTTVKLLEDAIQDEEKELDRCMGKNKR